MHDDNVSDKEELDAIIAEVKGEHTESEKKNHQLPQDEEFLPDENEDEEISNEEEDDDAPRFVVPKAVKVIAYITIILAVSFGIANIGWQLMTDVFGFSKPNEEVHIVIQDGETMSEVVNDLTDKGVVRYDWLFTLFCSITNAQNKIGTGSYTLNKMYDYNAIVNSLRDTSENRAVVSVTITEGETCRQIFNKLQANQVCSVEDLEETCAYYDFDYEFLEDIPFGNPYRLEGYLYPDTYLFYVGDSPTRVIAKFLNNFEDKFSDKLIQSLDDLNVQYSSMLGDAGFSEEEIDERRLTIHDIVVIASILEKETVSISERSEMASYIYNRMSSQEYPMLQMDITLRYAVNNWSDELSDEDYLVDSSYNTYRRAGLPDGAICNPGMESLRAALYPQSTEYYFYTKDVTTGQHQFYKTRYELEAYQNSLKSAETTQEETTDHE